MTDPLEEKYQERDVMQAAMQAAIAEHHRNGRAVPIWQDDRVMWLGPDGNVTLNNPTLQLTTDH